MVGAAAVVLRLGPQSTATPSTRIAEGRAFIVAFEITALSMHTPAPVVPGLARSGLLDAPSR
jgi:hypothetical protein